MFGATVIDVTRDDAKGYGTERLDDCKRSLGLWSAKLRSVNQNTRIRTLHTSTRASSDGMARSRIGGTIKSASIIVMDFNADWILETVSLSLENIARKHGVLKQRTSSLRISDVKRRF